MFARFDENPAMTLRVIKETKPYGRTDGQRENSIPPTNKVCGGENPAMTLRVIKETKRYGWTDGRTDNVKTVYPLQTKIAGGITKVLKPCGSSMQVESIAECSSWSILPYF